MLSTAGQWVFKDTDAVPPGHAITTAKDAGWDRLTNGELLRAAGTPGFEVLVTTQPEAVFLLRSTIDKC
jgi:hypothetical protein